MALQPEGWALTAARDLLRAEPARLLRGGAKPRPLHRLCRHPAARRARHEILRPGLRAVADGACHQGGRRGGHAEHMKLLATGAVFATSSGSATSSRWRPIVPPRRSPAPCRSTRRSRAVDAQIVRAAGSERVRQSAILSLRRERQRRRLPRGEGTVEAGVLPRQRTALARHTSRRRRIPSAIISDVRFWAKLELLIGLASKIVHAAASTRCRRSAKRSAGSPRWRRCSPG